MEVELMVTKRDDDRPTTDRVNIEQSATGRLEGRVLQKSYIKAKQYLNFASQGNTKNAF